MRMRVIAERLWPALRFAPRIYMRCAGSRVAHSRKAMGHLVFGQVRAERVCPYAYLGARVHWAGVISALMGHRRAERVAERLARSGRHDHPREGRRARRDALSASLSALGARWAG